MISAALGRIVHGLGERAAGSKPGLLRALVSAIIVGIAAAVLTFRLLRSGS
jgi:hypothetical protein